MSNWNDVLEELKQEGSTLDILRRRSLKALADLTGRNVIIYYSGWLQKGGTPGVDWGINDGDKIGFMIHKLDRSKGLDLVLHTPGGEAAAMESIVEYLRQMFGTNIRAIVPQIAMSAGSMVACSCKSILMGKHSSLGPIDPQLMGLPAHGIIEEFSNALKQAKSNPETIQVWQPIISRYFPTLIGECQKAISWSEIIVREWLKTGMFKGDPNAEAKINKIIKEMGSHALTLSHASIVSRCPVVRVRSTRWIKVQDQ